MRRCWMLLMQKPHHSALAARSCPWHKDDTLVVWRLDWLGRSLKDLIERVEELKQRQVEFRS